MRGPREQRRTGAKGNKLGADGTNWRQRKVGQNPQKHSTDVQHIFPGGAKIFQGSLPSSDPWLWACLQVLLAVMEIGNSVSVM